MLPWVWCAGGDSDGTMARQVGRRVWFLAVSEQENDGPSTTLARIYATRDRLTYTRIGTFVRARNAINPTP